MKTLSRFILYLTMVLTALSMAITVFQIVKHVPINPRWQIVWQVMALLSMFANLLDEWSHEHKDRQIRTLEEIIDTYEELVESYKEQITRMIADRVKALGQYTRSRDN